MDKAQVSAVNIQIALDETVTAPVSKGQRLGTMTIRSGEQVLAQIPMVAEQAVPRLTFGQLLLYMFRKITMAK